MAWKPIHSKDKLKRPAVEALRKISGCGRVSNVEMLVNNGIPSIPLLVRGDCLRKNGAGRGAGWINKGLFQTVVTP
jgi:hypothetical protein